MSLTALVPITREEPRVSPEELPKSEAQAGAGCWQQSARLWRWKEGRNAPLCHALPRLSPRSPCCSSHSPCSAHPAPLAAYAPGLQELCHRQPAHLALKDTKNTAGRAKLSEQMDDELHDAAGSSRSGQYCCLFKLWDHFLWGFAEKH